MAQQNRYSAYDFERFEPRTVSKSAAAPKINNPGQNTPDLKLVRKPKPSKAQLKKEANEALIKTFKIVTVAVIAMALFGTAIYSRLRLDEINREISRVDSAIETAKSDSVKLTNELNALVSIDKVEDYAENVLGMTKIQDYQVVYVDLSQEDSVVLADGKETGSQQVINEDNE